MNNHRPPLPPVALLSIIHYLQPVNTLSTASHTSSTVTAWTEASSGLTFLKRDECARPLEISRYAIYYRFLALF